MYLLGNLVWMIFGGLVSFLLWTVAGLICCLTIVGIPFGLQCLKIASFILWPFGKDVEIGRFGVGGFIGNLLWILLLGWELALTHLVFGLILCITIIGIPFGRQHFKLAKLSLLPFGARIYTKNWI
ncbi:MAG TPA: YccF domain-containing protein [Thermoclostridium caenicola]|uniref:Uncharacterized membrane protein YccF, DUF307 family n=1 Tax=Thermoclostridium caenicola TaxID=659425 RepID=A0A1M6HTP9_9FIRM|nr:YccF domain-containing protein [Thermoclostridium caenicola]SHJ25570.1 Uncharacterized membrane protein YccF, DUF307 family [Thermoclostridium caenicola]HOK42854.1 YccF domain-containing protein [Thermoclostridium caenicola]HOL85346.1 YccF domain-containing protein [Thermoclostridium caenicola]HOP72890.1 YccF domain-containing protein [Thermoclostridium caenicola]HPO75752.1 YccF domain-containing protein [Thermoclostridium caenicola]